MSSFKNIYISQLGTGISFLVSFCLLFITTYYLSVEDRGIFGLVYILPSLLITFTDFGIADMLIRYTSKSNNSNQILTSVFTLHFLRVFVIIFLSILVVFFLNDYLFKIPSIYLYLGIPLIFSLSANSYLSPYFFGSNQVFSYYFLLILPNFLILVSYLILIFFNKFSLLNVIILSCVVYCFHAFFVTYFFWKRCSIKNLKFYKEFYDLLSESKFLYYTNLLGLGFVYIFPIFLNLNFGLITLSYVLFSIAIADKLQLIGDSVGYEIIRRINVFDDGLTLKNKHKYFLKVIMFIVPVLFISAALIFSFTKFVLLEYWFQKYLPILEFLDLVIWSFIIQALIRLYQHFYNGLGDTMFTFFIILVGFLSKTLCLFFSNESITNLYLFFIIIDFILLIFIVLKTHFNHE